ncbi:MAG: hypothetical protein WBM14_03640 [Terracidiphilus sp.]
MSHTMREASCELLGDFFATLAHTTRMRIFCALQREAKTVTEIAGDAGVSITNASQASAGAPRRRAATVIQPA